jgi:hypothetical protein
MTLHGAAATRPERDGPERATMAAIRDRGVNFKNSHSMFPTFSTADAASFATGHYPGDTGDFSNTIYVGYPVKAANGSMTPYLEADPVLGDVDQHFDGNYLDEDTILLAARHQGPPSARWGRRLIFDHTERSGEETIIVDDSTGSPLSRAVKDKLAAAGLPIAAPGRGDNGKVDDLTTPGTNAANTIQQRYFADVASKVALPMLKARNKPFVLVFWSRDSDGTQHNRRDSLNELTLGINGPTSAAAVRNADDNLEQRQDALGELGLADDADIVIAADHGFSTISKQSTTSPAAKADYPDVPKGFLPSGFLAINIAQGLGLPLFDPDNKSVRRAEKRTTPRGNGLIGADPHNAGRSGRRQWRLRSGQCAEQGSRAGATRCRSLVGAGLCQRAVRRRRSRRLPRRAAAVGHQFEGLGTHATIAVISDRFRLAAASRCCARSRSPTSVCSTAGHARQLQPRRHHELHGRDRAGLQTWFCRRGAGQQRRYGPDHGASARSQDSVQGRTDGPRG